MQQCFWVFIGGGLGSICRFGIAELLIRYESFSKLSASTFPWATIIANALSCIILGCLVSLSLKNAIEQPYRLMLMTGFCGGFSTFSTFSNETYQLFIAGEHFYALLNIGVSLLICLICIWGGMKFGDNFL